MRVKYIGKFETVALERDKIYDVISIEKGWYRIMTELDEDYLFPPEQFEIIEDSSAFVEKPNRCAVLSTVSVLEIVDTTGLN